MAKLKAAVLAQAPLARDVIRDVHDPTDSRSPKQIKPAKVAARPIDRFTYALAGYSAERRIDGWWIAATSYSGDKPKWVGAFATIETACLAIARRFATEIADRHTRSIEAHKIPSTSGLYGLKATTRLKPPKGSSTL